MSPSSKRSREDTLPLPSMPSSSSSSPLKRSRTEPSAHSPKDLSAIFASVIPSSVVSTPSKSLTRRMLAKSSTEPDILLSPSPSRNVVTSAGSPRSGRLVQSMSMPAIPTSPLSSVEVLPPRLSPSPSSNRSKANVRTYAQARSFLIPLSFKNSQKKDEDDEEGDDGNDQSRESYSTLRTRLGVDHSEDNPFHVSGLNNDLSTITELRSKGEARRFLDEIGYLFEGLDVKMAPSVRRSSAFEIVTNMCDPEFMRRAKATDFTNHVWDALAIDQPDKVLDFYIAVFVALVARDERDVDNLCQKPGFFDVINRLLRYPKEKDALLVTDPRLLKSLFSKSELTALTNLRHTIIAKSDILSSDIPLSLRTLVLYTLKRIPISAIPEDLLSLIHQYLLDGLDCLRADIEAYTFTKGVPIPTAELHHSRQYLSLLDSTLITRRIDGSIQESLISVQKPLIAKLAVFYGAIQCSDARFSTLHDCSEDLLRVLINLSNLHSSWAVFIGKEPILVRRIVYEISTVTEIDGFSTDSQVSNGDNADKQCLALALLSNLVLLSDEIKDPLRETKINQACMRDVGCILQCKCAPQTSALQILTSLFVKMRVKSESQSFLFFQVHIAALLCLLTIKHPPNHRLIMNDLKKENALLGPYGLKESIQSFEKFYTPDSDSDAADNTGPIDIQMREQIKEACRSLCSY